MDRPCLVDWSGAVLDNPARSRDGLGCDGEEKNYQEIVEGFNKSINVVLSDRDCGEIRRCFGDL